VAAATAGGGGGEGGSGGGAAKTPLVSGRRTVYAPATSDADPSHVTSPKRCRGCRGYPRRPVFRVWGFKVSRFFRFRVLGLG